MSTLSWNFYNLAIENYKIEPIKNKATWTVRINWTNIGPKKELRNACSDASFSQASH